MAEQLSLPPAGGGDSADEAAAGAVLKLTKRLNAAIVQAAGRGLRVDVSLTNAPSIAGSDGVTRQVASAVYRRLEPTTR